MVRTFQSGLHQAGVPLKAIHREYFVWRSPDAHVVSVSTRVESSTGGGGLQAF